MSLTVLQDNEFKNLLNNIRFYDKMYPLVNEYVLAKITRYEDTGIYCYLNEYKREALLSFKDASSSKKLKNIKKQVKKGGSYILTVMDMDDKKGFIDVEKRSINEEEQGDFAKLILFYEKVFNIFVKAYYVSNPGCSHEEVYEYLRKTLWLQDAKLIEKNIAKIHTSPDEVSSLYNVDLLPNNDIIKNLCTLVKKPSYKFVIKLEVKSISLEGVTDITSTLHRLSKTLDINEFMVYGVPTYYSIIKTEYSSSFDPNSFLKDIRNKIEEFIDANKTSSIGIKIDDIIYKLV